MASTATLEVSPGTSVGPFHVGMGLGELLDIVQDTSRFPVVDFVYNESKPLASDYVLKLFNDGLRLRVSPDCQRLHTIEVSDPRKVIMSYSGKTFCGPNVDPTFVAVYQQFGPTYPGEYDPVTQCYLLNYPGLTFVFPIPPKFQSVYESGSEMPMELPDGSTPACTRVFVYTGKDVSQTVLPRLSARHEHYFEEVTVQVGKGIYFGGRDKYVLFGESYQEVVGDLGGPPSTFYKENDKLRIHATDNSVAPTSGGDYFCNYPALGVDVLFDSRTHTVKKIVLHTNYPGSAVFNEYVKCNFKLGKPSKKRGGQPDDETWSAPTGKDCVTPDHTWPDVEKVFGDAGKPVINKKSSAGNPFSATLFYGYTDVIFEVMKNQHVASVTLYCSAPDEP